MTACTPMVLFTGKNSDVDAGDARANHADLVKTLKAAKPEDLQPKQSLFRKVIAKAKAVTGLTADLSHVPPPTSVC